MISNQARIRAAEKVRQIENRLTTDGSSRKSEANGQSESETRRRMAASIVSASQGDASPHSPHPVDSRRQIAEHLAGLEARALASEFALGRMKARRLYRVADGVAAWARRPWQINRLFGGIRKGLVPVVAPVLRKRRRRVAQYMARLPEIEPEQSPYPNLRVAHVGRLSIFQSIAPHFELDSIDLDQQLAIGFDMLLVEPDVDDPLAALDSQVISRFVELDIPIVYWIRTAAHLDHMATITQASLVVTEDIDLATQAAVLNPNVLTVLPSVNEHIHNPMGWKRTPASALLLITDLPGAEPDLATLAPIEEKSLCGPTIAGLEFLTHDPERPFGGEQASVAKNHLAAYTAPQLSATASAQQQLAIELLAAGTPVIAPPDTLLTELSGGHILSATTSDEVREHLERLKDAPTRERISVPGRRYVLTHHTRRHRFEDLLARLETPTTPTPRISILLATLRPENVEHALRNVSVQDWPDKELILLLHGMENFDLEHIENLTAGLPFPTETIAFPIDSILGDVLNAGLDRTTGQYVTKMDDDDHYGPHHLTDLHTAYVFSKAHVTGKWGNVVYLAELDLTVDYQLRREEAFGEHIPGATMFMTRALLQKFRFSRVHRHVDTTLWNRMRQAGLKLYSTHRFGFIRVRHGDHTYVRGDEKFIALSTGLPRNGLDLEQSMV